MRAVLAAILATAACSGGPSSHACTEIGCQDQFTMTIHDPSGAIPSGAYTIEVIADGTTRSCSFTVPVGNGGTGCPTGLQVVLTQPQTCTTTGSGQYKAQTCTPVAGKLDETVSITGAPATVSVKQTMNGAVVLDESVTPAYKENRPNGPGCDPVCSQASVALTLATP